LEFQYALSGGPGGQHVNKTSSKAMLRFDVEQSPSLNDEQRQSINLALSNRIDKLGILQITSQRFRSQHKNREDTIARFQMLLASALEPENTRYPSTPPKYCREKRLDHKKQLSERKTQRQWKWNGD
jgi:ribosome-associated protein